MKVNTYYSAVILPAAVAVPLVYSPLDECMHIDVSLNDECKLIRVTAHTQWQGIFFFFPLLRTCLIAQ